MVRMRRTTRLFRGQSSNFGMLVNCKRGYNLSWNEHVDHVLKIIKKLEVEYVFSSNQNMHFLQSSLTPHETKILEHIWEFVLDQPKS